MSEHIESGIGGRVALVTGGSHGIGAAIARALAKCGAKVMVSGRDHTALARVVDKIRVAGGCAEATIAELTDEPAVRGLRSAVEALWGPVELLVACAGGGSAPRTVVEEDIVQWRSTIEGNLTSAFLTLKTFLPAMYARQSGSIVTIASAAGRQLSGAPVAYSAAKAGLLALTRQAAQEAAVHGVRINSIAPSAIVTERLAAQPPEVRLRMAQGFPLGRLGDVEDVAPPPYSLSPMPRRGLQASRWTLPVDGSCFDLEEVHKWPGMDSPAEK